MTLRTRILASMLLLFLAACGLVVGLTYASLGIDREIDKEEHANEVIRGVFALSLLGHEFQQYKVPRAAQQWRGAHERLGDRLKSFAAAAQDEAETQLVRRLVENHGLLADLFSRVESEDSENARRVAAQSLQVRSSMMVADANELVGFSVAAVVSARRVAFLIGIAGAMTVGAVLATMLFVNRRILHALTALTEAAGHFGRGDLRWRADVGGRDELTALGGAMEDMAGRLARSHAELAEANHATELASQAKSAFLANMSHEIRTPMNAIIGLARLLEESRLAPAERDYAAKIKLSASSLLGILNDILDFSKIEAGRLELEQTRFSVHEVVRNLAAIASSNGREQLEILFRVEPEVPDTLIGDPLRLQQVLLNLMGNSIKFTPAGEVVVGVGKVEEDQTGVTLAFSVRDTGVGIAPEAQTHLFQNFWQADTSTTRKYGGTGLGLAITGRLVALMGGRVHFTSEPGQGTEFRFTARFARAAAAAPAPRDLRGLAVLVVDDNATARDIIVESCRAFGWRTEAVASCHDGLERLRGGGFDVLLLDWEMPGQGGAALIAEAAADRGLRLPPVVVMARAAVWEQLRRAGPFAAVLTKPFTPSSLHDGVIQAVHGGVAPTLGPVSMPLAGRLTDMRVLLAEDNEINQEVAREILERAGAAVTVVGNGRAAVDIVAAAPGRFDAVLMDVQMPEMDGYAATRVIRGRLGLAALPIVAMTANAMPADRARALEAGMNAHVAKPIDLDELFGVLDRLVPTRRAAPETLAPPPAATAPAEPASLPALPGIDSRTALFRLGGNATLFASLLTRLDGEMPATLAEIDADRGPAAAALCHRLRGAAANVGAIELAKLATELEAAIKDGHDERVPDLLSGLRAAVATLSEAVAMLGVTSPPEPAPAAAVDPAEMRNNLKSLSERISANDLAALDDFAKLRPMLGELGEDHVGKLGNALERLDFRAAERAVADMLEALQQKAEA